MGGATATPQILESARKCGQRPIIRPVTPEFSHTKSRAFPCAPPARFFWARANKR